MEFALTYHVRIRLLSVGVLVALSLARAQSAEFEEYLRLAPNGSLAAPTQALVKKLKTALATTQ